MVRCAGCRARRFSPRGGSLLATAVAYLVLDAASAARPGARAVPATAVVATPWAMRRPFLSSGIYDLDRRRWRRRHRLSPPPPALDPRINRRAAFLLSVLRGGGGASSESKGDYGDEADSSRCYDYLTLGVVDLSPRGWEDGGPEIGGGPTAAAILALLADEGGGRIRITSVPRGAASAPPVQVGAFPASDGEDDDAGAAYETVGSLSDVVLLRLTGLSMDDEDHLLKIVDCVSGLLDGAERRSLRSDGRDNGTDRREVKGKQKLVILVEANLVEERRHVVESVLGVMLGSIDRGGVHGVGDEDKSESDDGDLRDGHSFVDLVAVAEDGNQNLDRNPKFCVIEAACAGAQAKKDVPLSAFPSLCRRVYRALGEAGDDAARGGGDAVAFRLMDLPKPPPHSDAAVCVVTELEKISTRRSKTDPDARLTASLASLTLRVRSNAELRLAALEEKMDDFCLDPDRKMPILEFGTDAESILERAVEEFDSGVDEQFLKGKLGTERALDEELVEAKRSELLTALAGPTGIAPLYARQLQSLREHYGRRYEKSLDDALEEYRAQSANARTEEGVGEDRDKGAAATKERRWKLNAMLSDAAGQAAEGFRAAAAHAAPSMCREGGILRDAAEYGYASELAGLLRDVEEVTKLRAGAEREWNEVMGEEEGGEEEGSEGVRWWGRLSGPARWYERLTARALVLGVNYLQGWLALQGLRRAAAERDRNMPKFPLF